MVERIWLAAEEPSAANQILLRHSGPILSDIGGPYNVQNVTITNRAENLGKWVCHRFLFDSITFHIENFWMLDIVDS